MIKNTLVFGKGNAKLDSFIRTFSLPAGFTCPAANECLSFANRETGKITDGKNTQFRCFSATSETIYVSVRKARWNNFELIKASKSVGEIVELFQSSIPNNTSYIRWHVSGDWFNETYFKAGLQFARNNPNIIIYGYTKRIDLLVKYKKQIPSNFRFVSSYGGKYDSLIKKNKLVSAKVVYSVNEAANLGLEIDHDDSKAIECKKSFALLLHGVQGKGTKSAVALNELKKAGYIGYSEINESKNHSSYQVLTPLRFTMKKNKIQLTLA
jgi:hypothetical protein